MSNYFHNLIPKSGGSLRPAVLSRTAHAIVKTLGNKKRNIKIDEKKTINENKAPIRRLRSEANTKRIKELTETKAKKSAVKRNSNRDNNVEECAQPPRIKMLDKNARLLEAVMALKKKNERQSQSVNEKIEELGFNKKDRNSTATNQIVSNNNKSMRLKMETVMNFRPAQQPYREKSTMPLMTVVPRTKQIKSYHTEESEDNEDENVESERNNIQETLLPVDNSVKHLISVKNASEPEMTNDDPFYNWNHPPSPSEFSFDLASSVNKAQNDNLGVKVNRERLVNKHTPWDRQRSSLFEKSDYTFKTSKRYCSMSQVNQVNEAESLKKPPTSKLPSNNTKIVDANVNNIQGDSARMTTTTRSSNASIRTKINKQIYSKYPNMLRPQNVHNASRYKY